MEKAETHQLLQVAGGTDLSDLTRINASRQEFRTIVDLDARQVIETKDLTGTQLPNHTGNTNAGVIQKLLTKAGSVLCFQTKIQLTQQHTPAFLSDGHPVTTSAPLRMTLQHGCHLLHHLQVKPEERLQTGALNLEHHLTTTAQAGSMHLGQRCSRKRVLIEINDLRTARTQLCFQQSLGLIKRKSRNLVLEISQFSDPARRQHIRTRRKQLTELDERRTEMEQFPGQPAGALLLTGLTTLRRNPAWVRPATAVPPEQEQQHQHRAPNAQRSQPPAPRERARPPTTQDRSSKRVLKSAT